MHPYSLDNDIRKYVYMGIAVIALLVPQYFIQLQGIFGVSEPLGLTLGFGAIYGGIYYVFDRFIWKILPHFNLIVNLDGKWKAKGESSFKDENGENLKYDIDIIIKQTFTKIEVFGETKESTSRSRMASIELSHAQPIVQYTFENTPKNMANEELQRHSGLVNLRIESENIMSGDYFSGKQRLRFGELKLIKVI